MANIRVLWAYFVLALFAINNSALAQPAIDTASAPLPRPCACCPNWGNGNVVATRGCPDLYKEQRTTVSFYDPSEISAPSNGRGQCAAFGTIQCWPSFRQPFFEETGATASYYYRQWVAKVDEKVVVFPEHEEPYCDISLTLTFREPLNSGSCLQPTPTPGGSGGGGGLECLSAGETCSDHPQCCSGACVDGRCGDAQIGGSPVLIDVSGNGFSLTNGIGGVSFDLNADGTGERISWTATGTDDAWIVLDRNGNGTVDNGSELFGDFTPQPEVTGVEKNGFLALAEFDKPVNGGNNDGVITSADAVFASLRLWQDGNHDGFSEATELHTLSAFGAETIELEYKLSKKTDEHGNQFRYRAKVKDSKGEQLGRWAWDVFLLRL